ncbi:outer membrane protein [Bartonella sp. B39]
MNIKSLITTSVIALVSASAAQAADVIIPHEAAPAVIADSAFSWTGFYFGAQIGNFSSKSEIRVPETSTTFTKGETPKPSGFIGGIYAGSNVDLGNGFILGIETDAVRAGREEAKTRNERTLANDNAATTLNTLFTDAKIKLKEASQFKKDDVVKDHNTYKEKWSGATRVRLGFAAADRFMPYIAGGIAYAQVQGIQEILGTRTDDGRTVSSGGKLYDETKTMVGYTLGGGVDLAMSDNVMFRAEYRYSDFGKKKFAKESQRFSYKTNDFRVGVAYKF